MLGRLRLANNALAQFISRKLEFITAERMVLYNSLSIDVPIGEIESAWQQMQAIGIPGKWYELHIYLVSGVRLGQAMGMDADTALNRYIALLNTPLALHIDAFGLSASEYRNRFTDYLERYASEGRSMASRMLLLDMIKEAVTQLGLMDTNATYS